MNIRKCVNLACVSENILQCGVASHNLHRPINRWTQELGWPDGKNGVLTPAMFRESMYKAIEDLRRLSQMTDAELDHFLLEFPRSDPVHYFFCDEGSVYVGRCLAAKISRLHVMIVWMAVEGIDGLLVE